jgi:DNA sulfur modification protein DndB
MISSNPVVQFPAVRGIQAGREYYTAQVPYKALVRMFVFDEEQVPARLRAQRSLNESRAKKIRNYILDNPTSYVLPALTVSIDGEMEFKHSTESQNLGMLIIDMDASMLINDGQHRRSGIGLAILENPKLANETLAVTIYHDKGLENSQQMFSDINSNQVKPSSSINTLYDVRNPFNRWMIETLDRLPAIARRIDNENSTVPKNSSNLWTLIGFSKFLSILTGITSSNFESAKKQCDIKGMQDYVVTFLDRLGNEIGLWSAMLNFGISAPELRENYIVSHTVFLHALAKLGKRMLSDNISLDKLQNLKGIDFSKTNNVWEGLCIINGKMLKNTHGITSTSDYFLTKVSAHE